MLGGGFVIQDFNGIIRKSHRDSKFKFLDELNLSKYQENNEGIILQIKPVIYNENNEVLFILEIIDKDILDKITSSEESTEDGMMSSGHSWF